MLRLQEHLRHLTLLDDSTAMYNRYPVADTLDDMHLMGNQHNGEMKLAVNV
ncbi:hypothetical protein D3C75_769400 [compost metagenome]